MANHEDSLQSLIQALSLGDYQAGYDAANLLDPNLPDGSSSITKDGQRATELYALATVTCEQAASAGDATAQAALAFAYLCGWGCTYDPQTAAVLLERAFDGGAYIVANTLACLYVSDRTGMRDAAKARLWYNRAEQRGCRKVSIPEFE